MHAELGLKIESARWERKSSELDARCHDGMAYVAMMSCNTSVPPGDVRHQSNMLLSEAKHTEALHVRYSVQVERGRGDARRTWHHTDFIHLNGLVHGDEV